MDYFKNNKTVKIDVSAYENVRMVCEVGSSITYKPITEGCVGENVRMVCDVWELGSSSIYKPITEGCDGENVKGVVSK